MDAESAGEITVFLLDDHEIVRRGVRQLLEAADIEVVGESGRPTRLGVGSRPGDLT